MPPKTEFVAQIYIKVDGSDIQPDLQRALISAEVDDSQHLPDMFALHFQDPELKLLEGDRFGLGKVIEIAVEGLEAKEKLLTGEVTSVELEMSQVLGPTLWVRGYDRSHRLRRIRRSRSFLQKKDSDIAKMMAQEAGLKPKVEETRQVYDYVLQNNQSNWEFLWERARRIGYRVLVEGDELRFEPAPHNPPEALTLKWSENLIDFRVRLTTAEQVDEVIVRGWDAKAKREIIGRATKPRQASQPQQAKTGPAATAGAFGEAGKHVVVDRPIASQAEADALAQALCDELGNSYIEAEGVSAGDPRITSGATIRLENVGKRLAGTYVVTHAVHRYEARGYSTHFTISGERPRTIADLLQTGSANGHGGASAASAGPARTFAIGIVTNNKDPENQSRVKVKLPWLADSEESDWARLVSPMAGADRGLLFLPEVNDEVLLGFEHGDIHRPFVLGALWNGQDAPPLPADKAVSGTGKVDKHVIKTRSGHIITFDDSNNEGSITIVDRTGGNKVTIDSQKNAIKLEAAGDIEVRATGKVSIEGTAGVEIKSPTASVTVKGGRIELN